MSVFTGLLRIKEFRESQAETELRRCRAALAEAYRMLEEKERRLVEFREWSRGHERSLYADICARIVTLPELEHLRAVVTDLRHQERTCEQEVRDAEGRRRQANEAVDGAVEVLREASKRKQKFTELARIYSEEARRELERADELEMEEFRTAEPEDADWEGGGDDVDTYPQ